MSTRPEELDRSHQVPAAAWRVPRLPSCPTRRIPGYYAATFELRPHFQLEGMDIGLRLVSRLPVAK